MNRFETYFNAFYVNFTTRKDQFYKKIGQFENLGFVIMSTRENIRLIARAPSLKGIVMAQQLCLFKI